MREPKREIVMATGELGRHYSRKGGAAVARKSNRLGKLIRVNGKAETLRDIMHHTGLPESSAMYFINKARRAGKPVTWGLLMEAAIRRQKS